MPYIFGELIPQSQLGHNGHSLMARNSIPADEIRAAYPMQDSENPAIKFVKIFKTEFQLLNYCRAIYQEDMNLKRSESQHPIRYLRPIYLVHFQEDAAKYPETEWKKEKLKFKISHKDGGTWKVAQYSELEIQCEVEYMEVNINDLKCEIGYLILPWRLKVNSYHTAYSTSFFLKKFLILNSLN